MANNLWLSTALAEEMAGSGTLSETMDGGYVDIYSGAVPVNADASLGAATLLCRLTLNADGTTPLAMDVVGRTVKKPSGAVWGGENTATGVATFFRHVLTGDTGDLALDEPRIQGTVGMTSASEMMLLDVAFTLGETFTLNSYAFEQAQRI